MPQRGGDAVVPPAVVARSRSRYKAPVRAALRTVLVLSSGLVVVGACDGGRARRPPRPVPAVVERSEAKPPAEAKTEKAADETEGKVAADVVAVPDSLVVDGVPPIPRAIAEAVGAYAEARSATALSWHPRERSLLIATRFADTDQIHEVKLAGGARKQLTFFRDPVRAAMYPHKGDGGFFVLSKDTGGDEFAQNWRLDRATGQLALLTDGKSKNGLGPWSNASDRFAYASTRRNGKDTDLWVVDPRDPKTDRSLAEVEGGGWSPIDWSPDDQRLLVENYVSVNESELWLFDLAGGKREKLTEKTGDTPVSWDNGFFTADGRAIVTVSDIGGEFRDLVRIELDGKKVTPLVPSFGWDVQAFAPSPDRKRMAATINEGGRSRLKVYDLPGMRERKIGAVPDGAIRSLVWREGGRELAFSVSSARSPSDVYVLDAQTGGVERWTDSEVGGLDPSTFSEPEVIRWKSFDEREIPGLYYRPPARFAGKRPVVVIVHGGPEAQSQYGFIGRNNYYLDQLGVALIYPNLRGSTGYGKSYVRLDNGERREDAVKDLGALLDWIATRPDLDAERVMIMGGSYGGYMTLASSVHHADRIRCAVDIVGISNFVTFLEHTEAYRRDLRRVEYGDERDPKMREFLQSISPLTHADKIKRPLFVIQGRNDPRVPVSEAEQIVATLKKQGTPVWYLEGKDEGHGFNKKHNIDFQLYATVLFMRTYLLDGMAE